MNCISLWFPINGIHSIHWLKGKDRYHSGQRNHCWTLSLRENTLDSPQHWFFNFSEHRNHLECLLSDRMLGLIPKSHPEFLIQKIWGGTQEFAFLIISQVTLMLLILRTTAPLPESNNSSRSSVPREKEIYKFQSSHFHIKSEAWGSKTGFLL